MQANLAKHKAEFKDEMIEQDKEIDVLQQKLT